jgi:drug/metabolite transporter (DMT)-like permease
LIVSAPGHTVGHVLAVVLALAAAVGYGGSDYCAGLAARRASVIRITLLAEVVSVVLLAAVLPAGELRPPSLHSVAWGATGGACGAFGALALYLGFRHAAFSVAGPISAVGAAGFSVLAGLLLGERPGGLSVIGIALALPAIVGVSASPAPAADQQAATTADRQAATATDRQAATATDRQAATATDRQAAAADRQAAAADRQAAAGRRRPVAGGRHAAGVAWGLVAGACFAVLFIGLNQAGSGSGLWPVAAAQVAALVIVGGIAAARGDLHLAAPGARWLCVITGVAGGGASVLYFLATHAGLLAVCAVITSLYPAVTIMLARIFVGERLTTVRLIGLCLAAASVGLIAAGGAQ